MKRHSCLLLLTLFLAAHSTSALDIGFYSNSLTYEVKEKLSGEAIPGQSHLDFGIAYRQISVFRIPVWNYQTTHYVLIDETNRLVYPLDREHLEELREKQGIAISPTPEISFWNAFGGKLVWLTFFLLMFKGCWKRIQRKREEHNQWKEIQETKNSFLNQLYEEEENEDGDDPVYDDDTDEDDGKDLDAEK